MAVKIVECRSALSPSRLPGLDWALNPYRGCSHSCAYCYAQDVTRFDSANDWGSNIEVKSNILRALKKELERGVRGVYGVGTVTDPYQAAEEKYELTRGCLILLKRFGARTSVLTKSDLVLRDLDVLSSWRDVEVGVSISCVDESLASLLEPGAPSPERRFAALAKLVEAGVDAYLMMAPIIPGITDTDDNIEALVRGANSAGIRSIIWDRYNPKPLAEARLRRALSKANLRTILRSSPDDEKRCRVALVSECENLGIRLKDAF